MDLQTSGLLFVIFLSGTLGIKLDGDGGYTDILIAISPAVGEDELLLQNIMIDDSCQVSINVQLQEMVIDASEYLNHAAGNRFYFKEVTILVPATWSMGKYDNATTEVFDKANVIVDEPNKSYGDEPYTLQYGQCGEEGKYIHFTPNFLLDDKFINLYGDRERVFVHEWGHLRWGLYDEYNEEQPFYPDGEGNFEATRCSKEIEGRWLYVEDGKYKLCTPGRTGFATTTSDCQFIPNKYTTAVTSIMAFPSLESVVELCSTKNHNAEAPNRQNGMCSNRAALDVVLNSSVDAGVPEFSAPIPIPHTIFRVVQRKHRTVCLTLDSSGSMRGSRLLHLRQAATVFLREIIEDGAFVGIIEFNSEVKGQRLIKIDDQSREKLVSALPTKANGATQMCLGILQALQTLKQDDSSTQGDEIVLFSDGESSDNLTLCVEKVKQSGAIVHTIALGPNADNALNIMANDTGGIFYQTLDSLDSTALVDAFASLVNPDGNPTKQSIQLESSGKKTSDWFNGTFSVDWTVGNGTAITTFYAASPPRIFIRSPSGEIFNESHFKHESHLKAFTLKLTGTAKSGEWHYSLLNEFPNAQSMSITVTSQAASVDVPPITVKAHMSQKSSDGSKAMVVYAVVTQKGLPVILANVTATIESETKTELQLLDNGAGADAFSHDGIYSRYSTELKAGRYSLKVKVKNHNQARLSQHKHSGVLYIPGYIVNGKVEPNPPKPPVNHQPVEVGSFSRTATGESFVVNVPPGYTPAFPPCKITDLKAKIEGDNVTLTWTAPGKSYDQGKASLYHIHWSEDLALLKGNFSGTHLLNTSGLTPQEAGSFEEYSFHPHNLNITNLSLFIVVTAENADSLRSEMSNIARVVNFIPAPPVTQSTNVAIAVGVTVGLLIVAMVIGGVIFWKKR